MVAVALAPAVKLLQEEETICGGLLWQIKNSGNRVTYNANPTLADFDEMIRTLDHQYGEQDYIMYTGSNFLKLFS